MLDDSSLKVLMGAIVQGEDEEERDEAFQEWKGRLVEATNRNSSGMKDAGAETQLNVMLSDWYMYFLLESLGDPHSLRKCLKDLNSPLLHQSLREKQ